MLRSYGKTLPWELPFNFHLNFKFVYKLHNNITVNISLYIKSSKTRYTKATYLYSILSCLSAST